MIEKDHGGKVQIIPLQKINRSFYVTIFMNDENPIIESYFRTEGESNIG